MSRHTDRFLLAGMFFSIIAALCVAMLYIPKAIITWDEARYLAEIYRMMNVLKSGDMRLVLSYSQSIFSPPPMQTWLVALPLVIIGFSYTKARLVGLVFFIIAALGIYTLGSFTDTKRGKVIGFVAMTFFLTSPIMLFLAGLALKEIPGIACTVLTVILFYYFRKKPSWYRSVSVGVGIIVTAFVKYPYAEILALVIEIEGCITLVQSKDRFQVAWQYTLIAVIPILVTAWWALTPTNRIALLIDDTLQKNYGMDYRQYFDLNWSANQLLFYPRAVLYEYSASVWIGWILLASCFAVPWIWRNFILRFSWIFFLLNIIAGTLHNICMVERYIITSIPLLFIIGSYVLVRVTEWAVARRLFSPVAGLLLGAGSVAAVLICIDLIRLPSYIYAVGSYTNKSAMFNQPDYTDLWFSYDRSRWSYTLPAVPYEKPKDVVDYIIATADPNKPIQIIGYTNEFSTWYFETEEEFARMHRSVRSDGFSRYIAVIQIFPSSRLYTMGYKILNNAQPWNVPPSAPDPSWTLIGQKNFRELGVDAAVYGL